MIHKVIANRELQLVTLSQVVGLLSSIIFIKLVSHYTSVAEYGTYSLVLSIAAFVALFPFTSFDQAISRYIPEYQTHGTFAANYTNILFLYTVLIGIFALGSLLLYPLMQQTLPKELDNIYLTIVIFTFLTIFRTSLLNIENFNRERKIVLYSRIFEGVFRIVLIIGIIYYYHLTASNILFVINIIFAINIAVLLIRRRNNLVHEGVKLQLLKKNFHNFYHFASPLLIWAVFSWIQLYVITWFLGYYTSTKEIGYFNLLNTIAVIIPTQLVGIIGTFIVPIMYQKEDEHKGYTRQKLKEITLYLSLFFSIVAVFLFIFHNFVVELLSSPKYLLYSWMLPYLFIASSLFNIALVWTYEFFVYKKTKQLLVPQIVPALVSIVSGYLLIPKYGVESVIYILLLSSLTYLLLVLLQSYKTFVKRVYI